MTSPNAIPADAVLVAIDIAKACNEVLIKSPSHKRRRRLSVLNNRAEHDRLVEVLQTYGRSVICAFEATGNYHRPIAWRLAEAGFEVQLVSSLALARTREALHNSWDKNDPKDAQVILHMLRIRATQVTMIRCALASTTCRNCRRRMKRSPGPRPRSSTAS